MKVYDCFLFNTELDILLLRLEYLYHDVDHFVLVESPRTLSNLSKPLHYAANKEKFEKYADKIIHVVADKNDMDDWQYEFYQRNCIKNGLVNCNKDDLVFVSDVDEIINVKHILSLGNYEKARVIDINMYYYYINLKQDTEWLYNIVAPYAFIQNLDLGIRYQYRDKADGIIKNDSGNNGWHFSYLFGSDLDLYVNKIRSFSHQEFNKDYFLIKSRIRFCIEYGYDLFERPIKLEKDDSVTKVMQPIIDKLGLENYIYQPVLATYLQPLNIYWFLRVRIFKRVYGKIKSIFKK